MKSLFNISVFLLISLLTFSCGKRSAVISPVNTDRVALIFDFKEEARSENDMNRLSLYYDAAFLSYMNIDSLPVFLSKESVRDTLELASINGYIEIAIVYNNVRYKYFYLKGGDTVTISFDKFGRPYAKSSLSDRLTEQYNVMTYIETSYNEIGIHPEELYKKQMTDKLQLYDLYNEFLAKFRDMLEQADNTRSMDSVYIDYYNYLLSIEEYKYNSYSVYFAGGDTPKYESIALNDDYTIYISYYYSPLAALSQGGYNYYSVISNPAIPSQSKMLVLFYCLRLWNTHGDFFKSPRELEPYYDAFLSCTHDPAALEYLKNEFYDPDSSSDLMANEMFIEDMNGNRKDFESVLSENIGSVIYVDFWASWCSPCIGGFSTALQLREQYKNKNVVFVYLCINDKKDEWRKITEKYRLDYLGESYYVINPDAAYIKKLQISTIPRYLLYGTDGVLINHNAPRPGNKDIIQEIEKSRQRIHIYK